MPEHEAITPHPTWTFTDGVTLYGTGATPEAAYQDFMRQLQFERDRLDSRIELLVRAARRV